MPTIAIGDIHGDLDQLERVLAKLPSLTADDTLVFLGDYLDRGPKSAQVIARVQALPDETPARVVTLRGNHEDAWLQCLEGENAVFLLLEGNGCRQAMRSFVDCSHLDDMQTAIKLLSPKAWFPEAVRDWMKQLSTWYEDDHAIYVHAGLEGEGTTWLHPRLGHARNLMWQREPDFFAGYQGKRLIFGHTPTTLIPVDPCEGVWRRGDLIGIDTGCGKGGWLTAIELPSLRIFDGQ